MNPIEKTLHDKFYTDPDWKHIESKILAYITPLLDLSTVDMTAKAENVKVEVKGRLIAHETLTQFLLDSGIIKNRPTIKSTFK